MFDIDDNRASGLECYSSLFFKASWSIVGHEVYKAVMEFFWSGKMLKEINSTPIVLVPKSDTPRRFLIIDLLLFVMCYTNT